MIATVLGLFFSPVVTFPEFSGLLGILRLNITSNSIKNDKNSSPESGGHELCGFAV